MDCKGSSHTPLAVAEREVAVAVKAVRATVVAGAEAMEVEARAWES